LKSDQEHNEVKLLLRLQKGDERAFEILFHRYKNRVKGFVHKMLPPHISSDKIVQEVFIKIWLRRKKIDSGKKFSSYLFAISKNLVLDEIKLAVHKKLVYVESHVLEEVAPEHNEYHSTETEMYSLLQKVLQKLPQRRRHIFSLSRFDGLSYKQIASKLNITENTVDTQIRKSLQFLRQEFSNIL
jgi:RNA polymerase sigma-70 factor (ECF subfamily)